MSSFNTPWFNSQDPSFFNVLNKTKVPHVVLCAETEDFDEDLIQTWTDEGFHTVYCPLLNGGENFIKRVHTIGDNFGVSEQYAIVGRHCSIYLSYSIYCSQKISIRYSGKFDITRPYKTQPPEAHSNSSLLPIHNPLGPH